MTPAQKIDTANGIPCPEQDASLVNAMSDLSSSFSHEKENTNQIPEN